MSTATLQMLAAVDNIIAKARTIHEGVPEVTVVLGASGVMRKGQKHGHFAPKSWKSREDADPDTGEVLDGEFHGEVLLSGESLQRGAEATLGTILHELAHAYAHSEGIVDTSNNNRYHSKKFKSIAEEFGLHIEKADVIGWSVTTVPETTLAQYAEEVSALEEAITQYRVPNLELKVVTKQKKFKMQCPECQDPIQTTKKWWGLNEHRVWCYEHDTGFEMFEEVPA